MRMARTIAVVIVALLSPYTAWSAGDEVCDEVQRLVDLPPYGLETLRGQQFQRNRMMQVERINAATPYDTCLAQTSVR